MIVNPITNVFQETFLDNDFMYFYRQARLAKYKYISNDNYNLSEDDKCNLITVASAWSASIRKAWRLFILSGKYEPFEFWNAFVSVFILGQNLLLDDMWVEVFKQDKEFLKLIKKTSNPKFIEKMFTGMDWKYLRSELNKMREGIV